MFFYFLDYLSKNQVSKSISTFKKPWLGESESGTIKCSRMFPIKPGRQFDLEHFCYSFGSLSLKYSLPEQTSKIRFSDDVNRANKYSSLFNIAQPPVFHNSLKKPLGLNNKNEWIFGQSFLNSTKKQDLCHKTLIKPNNLVAKATEENSNKIKHCNILQKSVLDLKTDCLNRKNISDTMKNRIPAKESVQNPFQEIRSSNGLEGGTKGCFRPVSSDINSKKTILDRKGDLFLSLYPTVYYLLLFYSLTIIYFFLFNRSNF